MPTEGLTVSGIFIEDKTESGGLSGEHIQLCAEGARRKPNLSGKRTEICDAPTYAGISPEHSSSDEGCFFVYNKM